MARLENTKQETKDITYPVWKDRRKHLFSLSEVIGTFALWAVRQSPYLVPEKLTEACEALGARLAQEWDGADLGFKKFTADEIEKMLVSTFEHIPEIMAWNEPKNKLCSRFSKPYPDPDSDFIDLDALARNISHTLLLECLYNED